MSIEKQLDEARMSDRIRLYREIKGLTQSSLADATGINQGWISRIESGKAGIGVSGLSRIAKALGVTTSHLLGEVPFLAEWSMFGDSHESTL